MCWANLGKVKLHLMWALNRIWFNRVLYFQAPEICVGINLDVLKTRYTAAAQSFGFSV